MSKRCLDRCRLRRNILELRLSRRLSIDVNFTGIQFMPIRTERLTGRKRRPALFKKNFTSDFSCSLQGSDGGGGQRRIGGFTFYSQAFEAFDTSGAFAPRYSNGVTIRL